MNQLSSWLYIVNWQKDLIFCFPNISGFQLNYCNYIKKRNLKPHSFLSKSGSWPPMKGWLRKCDSKPICLSSKTANRICWVETNNRSLVWHSVLLTSTLFILTVPTAQEALCLVAQFWNNGEEFTFTMLCKPTFLKIIFLYLKRLWDSYRCVYWENHHCEKPLCTISKPLVLLELVTHCFLAGQFHISILG